MKTMLKKAFALTLTISTMLASLSGVSSTTADETVVANVAMPAEIDVSGIPQRADPIIISGWF